MLNVAAGILLAEEGWQLDMRPGHPATASKGEDQVAFTCLMQNLAQGEVSSSDWLSLLGRHGLSEKPVVEGACTA